MNKFKLYINGKHYVLGKFEKQLYDLIFTADLENLKKLKKIYPEKVEKVAEYKGIEV